MAYPVDAILFDKDGTLLDADRTWATAAARVLSRLALPDRVLEAVCDTLGLLPGPVPTLADQAPLLWMSNPEIAARLDPLLDGDRFVSLVSEQVLANLHPVEGAEETVRRLRARGVPLGIVTNDSAQNARRQFLTLGWQDLFDAVLGHDSGYAAKPEPDMVVAAARHLGVRRIALVGDSDADVAAAVSARAYAIFFSPGGEAHERADATITALSELVGGHVGAGGLWFCDRASLD